MSTNLFVYMYIICMCVSVSIFVFHHFLSISLFSLHLSHILTHIWDKLLTLMMSLYLLSISHSPLLSIHVVTFIPFHPTNNALPCVVRVSSQTNQLCIRYHKGYKMTQTKVSFQVVNLYFSQTLI